MKIREHSKTISNTEKLYQNGINVHVVIFDELAKFNTAKTEFARNIKRLALTDSWEKNVVFFNTLYARLARSPCSPAWLCKEISHDFMAESILEINEQRIKKQLVDSTIAESFYRANESIKKISTITENPFSETLKNLFSATGDNVIVLGKTLWDRALSDLQHQNVGKKIEILDANSLRNHHSVEKVFIFGPTGHLKYNKTEYLVRATIAKETHILACKHEYIGSIKQSLLITENDDIPMNGVPQSYGPDLTSHDFEPAPDNTSYFTLKTKLNAGLYYRDKTIRAIPFKFANGKGTYLNVDCNVWVVGTTCENGIIMCTGVHRIPVKELEEGYLLLMTTEGGGDMIPSVADMLIPNAFSIRSRQREWKDALKRKVENEGYDSVIKQMKQYGSTIASTANIRVWCHSRSIGMDNLAIDLKAILTITEMDKYYEEIANGIRQLRSAHQAAGHQLQKKLIESIKDQELCNIKKSGYQIIRHEESGAEKTIYLVEARGSESEIPEDMEGELLETGE